MLTLHVSNLSIQFDTNGQGSELDLTLDMIEKINVVLSENFPDSQPQIYTSGIDNSDIEIM
jgi:hypothetical protein